jgi:hypothetical protein
MTNRDRDLLDLLRLRDGALPPAEEAALRQRLADEADLRSLEAEVASAMSSGAAWDDSAILEGAIEEGAIDEGAEDVGAAWERGEGLARPSIEPGIWYADVAALERAAREPAPPLPPAVTARLTGELSALRVFCHDGTSGSRSPHVVRTAGQARSGTHEQGCDTKRATPGTPLRATNPPRPYPHRTSRGPILVLATASALCAVAWWFWNHRPPSLPRPVPGNESHEIVGRPPEKTPVDQPQPAPQPSPNPPPPVPNRSLASDNTAPHHEPILPELAPEPEPMAPVAVAGIRSPILWTRLQGVLARRDDSAGTWTAVSELAPLATRTASLRTLGESWAEGRAESGETFHLAGNTRVAWRLVDGTSPGIEIEAFAGRLGLTVPRAGTTVSLLDEPWRGEWIADEPNTTLVFEAENGKRRVSVVNGAARSGSVVLRRTQSLVHEPRLAPRIRATTGSFAWLKKPATQPAAERRLAQAVAAAEDLLAGLLTPRAGATDAEWQIAARWSFDLDPTEGVTRAAESPVPALQLAAIRWLSEPGRSPDELQPLAPRLARARGATTLDLEGWYRAARGETPVTAELVRELAIGIGEAEPVFVRQTAITFLRRITGQPFPRYNALQPAPADIAEVRAAARLQMRRMGR